MMTPTPFAAASPASKPSADPRNLFYVATTPGAESSPVVRSLRGQLDERSVIAVESQAHDLGLHLRSNPRARACVLIESPMAVVRRSLAGTVETDLAAALAGWATAGRQLLRAVLAHPDRCLCADLDEAAAAGPAWNQALARWVGRADGSQAALPPAEAVMAPSALDEVVAQAVIAGHADSTRLFEELLACCVVLGTMTTTRNSTLPEVAAAELRTLRARQTALSPADAPSMAELIRSQEEARDTLERLHMTQEELESALTELGEVRRRNDQSDQDFKHTETQLASALNELEPTRLELSRVRQRLDESDLARKQAEALRASALAELAAAQRAADLTSARLAQRDTDLADRDAQRAAARREADSLLERLHEANEKLERYYLQYRSLTTIPALLAHEHDAVLYASGVHIVGEHDGAKHQHADIQFRDVRLAGRRRADFKVRLVEHLGRPGLVLFSTPRDGPLVSAWQASGQEQDAEYMLIVPSDTTGRTVLQRMGSTDWRVVASIAGLVLRGTREASAARWAGVAHRLCHQLAALPPRLRYDGLSLSEEAGTGTMQVTFNDVMFGALALPSLVVAWEPSGSAGNLSMVAVPTQALPLAHWPADEQGVLAQRWRLPVGPAFSRSQKLRIWSALPATDGELVLALLDALPAVGPLARPEQTASLVQGARTLHREARKLRSRLVWYERLRRLLKRGGRS